MINDVSIDLETLDKIPTSHIATIGAVKFDLEHGDIGERFERRIIMENQPERTFDANTIRFWMDQPRIAREPIICGDTTLPNALADLADFLGDKKYNVWGNGATFDISILEDAYAHNPPWEFWAVNDMRTIVRMAKMITGFDKKTVEFEGQPHVAVDDAAHQAKTIHMCYAALATYHS